MARRRCSGTARSGEIALLLAILEDALRVVLRLTPATQRLRDDTYLWLFTDEWESLLSFRRLCEALDLDPGVIRTFVIDALGRPGRTDTSRAQKEASR